MSPFYKQRSPLEQKEYQHKTTHCDLDDFKSKQRGGVPFVSVAHILKEKRFEFKGMNFFCYFENNRILSNALKVK